MVDYENVQCKIVVGICNDVKVQKCLMWRPQAVYVDQDIDLQRIHGHYFLIYVTFR